MTIYQQLKGHKSGLTSFTHVLCVLVGMSLLSSCFGKSTYRWKEEVQLHDGRVIVIERSVRTGEVPVEIGQPPGESDYTLRFKNSDGKSVTWESSKSLRPMTLDFVDGVPYVVATGITGNDYARHGCPKPPYVIFEFKSGSWERITYEQLPKSVRRANLYSSPTRKDRLGAVKSGFVTVQNVKDSHLGLDSFYKEVRADMPMPLACIARGVK